jgi:hypothetical protein
LTEENFLFQVVENHSAPVLICDSCTKGLSEAEKMRSKCLAAEVFFKRTIVKDLLKSAMEILQIKSEEIEQKIEPEIIFEFGEVKPDVRLGLDESDQNEIVDVDVSWNFENEFSEKTKITKKSERKLFKAPEKASKTKDKQKKEPRYETSELQEKHS